MCREMLVSITFTPYGRFSAAVKVGLGGCHVLHEDVLRNSEKKIPLPTYHHQKKKSDCDFS